LVAIGTTEVVPCYKAGFPAHSTAQSIRLNKIDIYYLKLASAGRLSAKMTGFTAINSYLPVCGKVGRKRLLEYNRR
jgi:3D (Asp-Asp-Asp) domain-containing protein